MAMNISDGFRWVVETTRLAVFGWLRFSAVFLGFTVIGLVLSRELPRDSLVATVLLLAGVAAVCFVGAWAYSAMRFLGASGKGYHLRWVLSGMLAAGLFGGLPMMSGHWFGGDPGFDPLLWVGFWSLVGGVAAYAYGRIAQDFAS